MMCGVFLIVGVMVILVNLAVGVQHQVDHDDSGGQHQIADRLALHFVDAPRYRVVEV